MPPPSPRSPRPRFVRWPSNSSASSNDVGREASPNTVVRLPRPAGDVVLDQRVRFQAALKPFFRTRVTCDVVKSLVANRLGSGKFGSVFRFKGPDDLVGVFAEYGIAVKPLWLAQSNRRTQPPSQKRTNHYETAKPMVEVFMLMLMSQEVERRNFPHFPLVHAVKVCGKESTTHAAPNFPALVRHREDVALVFSELARGDLASWLEQTHPANAVASAICQAMLSLFAFRALGFEHNDAHAKNFLYHSVRPGGFWHYKLYGQDVYIQNCGHLIVLWDPMLATHASPAGNATDPERLAGSIGALTHYDRHALRILGSLIRPNISHKYPGVMTTWLEHLRGLELDAVRVGASRRPRPDQILNKRPYRFNSKPFVNNAGNANASFARLFKQYNGTQP